MLYHSLVVRFPHVRKQFNTLSKPAHSNHPDQVHRRAMAGTIVIGPAWLQSWLFPGDEAPSDGWAQNYVDELGKPKRRQIPTKSCSDETVDIERQMLLASESEVGYQGLDEKLGRGELLEPRVSFTGEDYIEG